MICLHSVQQHSFLTSFSYVKSCLGENVELSDITNKAIKQKTHEDFQNYFDDHVTNMFCVYTYINI